jgi:AraC-like DNA-binding protein
MTVFVRYDFHFLCKTVLKELLDARGLSYEMNGSGEVEIRDELTAEQKVELTLALEKYGIEIIEDQKTALVQRIKIAIDEMLEDDTARLQKFSCYLADKLNYSYTYLSTLFSEATFTSIENFIILRKVDHVKELMSNTELTLTEIAYKLDYSSVAHLSGQFKKTTGLTPTAFQNILEKRKENSILL